MEIKESAGNEAKDEDDKAKPAIILKLKRRRFLKQYVCTACRSSYAQMENLKYHVRREHFNFIAKITKRDKRELHEIWLEKVANSEAVIEIKKTGHNKYLMKKSDNPECIKIVESKDTIDLSPLYPDDTKSRIRKVLCHICDKRYFKHKYRRHLEEEHDDLLL